MYFGVCLCVYYHCLTLSRSPSAGIWENCRKLLNKLDACPNWVTGKNKSGKKETYVPSTHLKPRLKRLWNFIRLQLHLHFEVTSDIGSHCLNLKLGSLAEPKFNNCCEHHEIGAPPSLCPTISEECEHDGCDQKSRYHCMHCTTSFCRDHIEENVCTQECLPTDFKKKFICRKCSPNVEKKSHKAEGCASCNEIEYFKKDLLHCVKATADDDIIGRAKDVCDSIDIMQGHTARVSNQVAMI